MMQKQFTSIVDAARRLGVPVAWLRSEAQAGRVPHLRAGRRWLFDPDVVARVLDDRAKAGTGKGVERA
ncbi:MAG: helix-turn-helix domain-containing protein [Planctomycetes bacterium]|nr:helix-turn-helix domain-containing protein [Planctomycetota bacterium]